MNQNNKPIESDVKANSETKNSISINDSEIRNSNIANIHKNTDGHRKSLAQVLVEIIGVLAAIATIIMFIIYIV